MNKKEWLKTLKEIKEYCQLTICCGCMLYVNGRCEVYGEPMEWNVDEIDSKSPYLEG